MRLVRVLYGSGLAWGLYTWVAHPAIEYRSRLFAALFPPVNSLLAALLVFDLSVTPPWLVGLSARLWGWPRRAMSFVAAISYALYLYHLEAILLAGAVGLTGWPGVVCALLVGGAVAVASYVWVERPFLRLRERWLPAARERTLPTA